MIDFGSWVGNIHNSYKAGDNWYLEMFIESTSFAASAGVGVAAANVGAFLLALTPFGWIGLIVGRVIVAGALALPRCITRRARQSKLSAFFADADVLGKHVTRFDVMIARIFLGLLLSWTSAIIILMLLDKCGVFAWPRWQRGTGIDILVC